MTTPNSYRLRQFALRFLDQANVVWIGDSICADGINTAVGAAGVASSCAGAIVRRYPGVWKGITTFPLNNGAAPGPACTAQPGTGTMVGLGTAGSGGMPANLWPSGYGDSGVLGNLNWFDPYYVYTFSLAKRQSFRTGDWFTEGMVDLLTYVDSALGSVQQWGCVTDRNGSNVTYVPDQAWPNGYVSQTLDCGSGAAGDARAYYFAANGYDETGKHFHAVAAHFYHDVEGLSLSFAAVGGWTVQEFIDLARISANAKAQMCAWRAVDTVVIWLGQNGTVNAQWKTDLNTLIGMWRTAMGTPASGRTPMFLLIATYDTNQGSKHTDIAQHMYELALANADVSFYNLYARAGSFATLNATYLADGVHPNSTGADYFIDTLQADLAAAIATDPDAAALIPGARTRTRMERARE